jgi:glycosyltransferase involved in cell wall biosynthesis
MPSVVVPAHNEEQVIGRLLDGLLQEARPGELHIVVVCNGCTDGTAAVAQARGPDVHVESIPVPSKIEALRLGDRLAAGFPRLYVDADVELATADVRALCTALTRPRVLAAAPTRVVPLVGTSWPVRAFYELWQQLPQVRSGLFGRGVVAVDEVGHRRVAELPDCMSDDLFLAESFGLDESMVVSGALVIVHPPRTWADLLRRRTRAMAGNRVARETGASSGRSRTTAVAVARVVWHQPRLVLRLPVFAATTVLARRRARALRRAGDVVWLRDESSRLASATPPP